MLHAPDGGLFGFAFLFFAGVLWLSEVWRELFRFEWVEWKKNLNGLLFFVYTAFSSTKMTRPDQPSSFSPRPSFPVMCCMCKKIKVGKGDWVPADPAVLLYIGDVFSHGYCPGCRDEMQEKVDDLDTVHPSR